MFALGCICGWQQSYIHQQMVHCMWLYTVPLLTAVRGLQGENLSTFFELLRSMTGLAKHFENAFSKPQVIFGRNSFAYVNLRVLAPHFRIFQWSLASPNGLAIPWLLSADKCNSVFFKDTNKQTNEHCQQPAAQSNKGSSPLINVIVWEGNGWNASLYVTSTTLCSPPARRPTPPPSNGM